MNTGTARRSRARRLLTLAGVLGLVTFLGACGGATEKCEQLITETVEPVEGVESVEAVCRDSFGSSGASAGTVNLAVNTKAEADEVVVRIEKAMAHEPRIQPDWRSPSVIVLGDGTRYNTGGTRVDALREIYGIEP